MFNVNTKEFSRHLNCFTEDFSHLLDVRRVSDVLEDLGVEFRSRIFTPFLTLHGFLNQALGSNSSCMEVVSEIAVWRKARGLGEMCLSSGSFSKAKARLPLELIKRLTKEFCDSLRGPVDEEFGRVFVVDGTGISMSDTKQNVSKFPKHGGDGKGKGFPVARLLGLFSLSTGALIDLEIGPWKGKGTGEISLMHRLWRALKEGDTLLGDSLFVNFPVLASALIKKVHVVGEFPSGKYKKRIKKRKTDQIIVLEKPRKPKSTDQRTYDLWPEFIKVRIVKITCAPRGFRPKAKYILTTNLSDIAPSEIQELYRRRWEVEINFRSIKQTMGMDFLRSRSPNMFEKEVWIYALAYNLVRTHMLKAGLRKKQFPYNLSFAVSLMLIRTIRMAESYGATNQQDLFALILRAKPIGTRPNRYEPRAVKLRKKSYAFLSEPRKAAKQKLHSKKGR